MDRLIRHFDCVEDGDLMLCPARGVAYQKEMTAGRVAYNAEYLAKCSAYDATISANVNTGRVLLMKRHLPKGARILDIGAAAGEFMQAAKSGGYDAFGYDVITEVAVKLKDAGVYAHSPEGFDAVTMWDTLEHLEDPEWRLRTISKGAYVFISIPAFDNLDQIRESKHYRPGEHLYYWTTEGFIAWMAMYGFRLLEISNHEVLAGRDSIAAFAFQKDLPTAGEYVGFYDEMHSTRFYGSSATELHLDTIADAVRKFNPRSILDYGCGRGDLAAHFWLDGARKIGKYDPAISKFKTMPEGTFDLVLCCDVMEHIPVSHVENVFNEIRSKSEQAIFTISTKLARAKLPNGENAHITLLTNREWLNWITEIFGKVEIIPSQWEHELIVKAGNFEKQAKYAPCIRCKGEVQQEVWVDRRGHIHDILKCRDCGETV